MIPRIPKASPAVDWSLVSIVGDTMPPRDPDDEDDEEEDDDIEREDDREPGGYQRARRRRVSAKSGAEAVTVRQSSHSPRHQPLLLPAIGDAVTLNCFFDRGLSIRCINPPNLDRRGAFDTRDRPGVHGVGLLALLGHGVIAPWAGLRADQVAAAKRTREDKALTRQPLHERILTKRPSITSVE
jgi:hypothetical protein